MGSPEQDRIRRAREWTANNVAVPYAYPSERAQPPDPGAEPPLNPSAPEAVQRRIRFRMRANAPVKGTPYGAPTSTEKERRAMAEFGKFGPQGVR